MKRGFALPTVLIASSVMIMVLFTALAAAASMGGALDEQYYNKLAREAAESGVSRARTCYPNVKSTATTSQWPNALSLTPQTNCLGATISGQSATVLNLPGEVRTRFVVAPAQTDNGVTYFEVRGYAERLRSSNQSTPVMTYTQGIKYRVRLTQTGIVSGKKTVCSIVAYKLYCWGRNDGGQVGDGTKGNNRTSPKEVKIGGPSDNYYVQAVASGWEHTCAITSLSPLPNYTQTNQTQIWCWGQNTRGQLGYTPGGESLTPRLVTAAQSGLPTDRNFIAISARDHVCVIGLLTTSTNKGAYCWGYNASGQAGDLADNSVPAIKFPASSGLRTAGGTTFGNVMAISAIAPGNTCLINSSSPYCLGLKAYGLLGQPEASPPSGNTARGYLPLAPGSPNPLTGKTTKISIDYTHACAIASQRIWCWGSNLDPDTGTYGGRLDPGIAADTVWTPTQMAPASNPSKAFIDVTSASASTCAVDTNYKVWCWGDNLKGELGQGTAGALSLPGNVGGRMPAAYMVQVKGPLENRNVKEITSGGRAYCVITDEEESYCWGDNQFGQLGNKTTTDSSLPVRVEFISGLLY